MNTILVILILGIGGIIVVFNWYSIFASHRLNRHVSAVPILGGLLLFFGLLGFEQTSSYAWAGFFIDYGTLILLIAIPTIVREIWSTSSFNQLHRFVSDANGRRDDIRLFKRGKCTIETSYDPPVPSNEHGALAVSQSRVGSWRGGGGRFYLEKYAGDRILKIVNQDGEYITEEENYPETNEFQHDRLGKLSLKQIT